METNTDNETKSAPDSEKSANSKMQFNHPDINRVFIAGSLLHDPPLRRTRKGVPVTNFIVVTQPEEFQEDAEGFDREQLYISVVVWAKQAVQCSRHLKKGSSVIILGELQSMPNASVEKSFFPVQISAQWIQYLEKDKFTKIIASGDDEFDEEMGQVLSSSQV